MKHTIDTSVTDVTPKGEQPALIMPTADLSKLQREEGQVELIEKCRELLVMNNIAAEQLAVYDNDPSLRAAKNLNTATQRVALNQFWSLQLSPFGQITHPHRIRLIENGSVMDWLRLFGNGPLQFIIENNLPVQYD